MYRDTKHRESFNLNRFGEPAILVLFSLTAGPKHGYAMVQDIERETGMKLGPGTLYGALTKLLDNGLIRPVEADGRRRPYAITGSGRAAFKKHIMTWSHITARSRRRLAGESV